MQENTKATDNLSMRTGKGFLEGIYFEANMRVELFDETGKLKDQRFVHNTVTTAAKTGIINQLLASPSLNKLGWMAVGTSSPGATLLGAEIARVVFDSKLAATNVLTVVCTFPAGTGTGAITESGTFDVVTANTVNMWMSSSFSVINKGSSDSIVITWTLTVN